MIFVSVELVNRIKNIKSAIRPHRINLGGNNSVCYTFQLKYLFLAVLTINYFI